MSSRIFVKASANITRIKKFVTKPGGVQGGSEGYADDTGDFEDYGDYYGDDNGDGGAGGADGSMMGEGGEDSAGGKGRHHLFPIKTK